VKRLRRWLIRIAASERGQDMVEYALITVMVSIPIVLAAMILPSAIEAWSEQVAAAIPGAGG
jgi:Flp pilus assembly pilin Flp